VQIGVTRLAQTIDVKRGWMRKPATDDHAVALARLAVARGAKNVEALASALHRAESRGRRRRVRITAERATSTARRPRKRPYPLRDGVGNRRPRRARIAPQRALGERLVARLVVHVPR